MKLISAIILSTLFFAVEIFAQTPAQIDVTSLTVTKGKNPEASFSITATGLPAPYQSPLSSYGSAVLLQLENSSPSRVGDIFRTSFPGGGNSISHFYLGGSQSSRYVKFTLIGTSSEIVIYPTILRKKQRVILTVPASVKGKIEIFDGNTLIAVDDDVDLNGTLKVNYVQYLLNTTSGQRRAFDFTSFTFSYTQ